MATVTGEPRFRDSVRSLLRERILDAATELVVEGGWAQMRMAHLSDRVGISRQTLYNEFGSKPALGEALVGRETERFLAGVAEQLRAHDDPTDGIGAAVEYTLRAAGRNPLLRAILTATRGGAQELLPLLTSRSAPILAASAALVLDHARTSWPRLAIDDEELLVLVDSIVRLTVSHVVLPAAPPERTAERISRLAGRLIATDPVS
jgi:AcrR family transcriptional regulator